MLTTTGFLTDLTVLCKQFVGHTGTDIERSVQVSGAFRSRRPATLETLLLCVQNPLDLVLASRSDIQLNESHLGLQGSESGKPPVGLQSEAKVVNLPWTNDHAHKRAMGGDGDIIHKRIRQIF
jgi:hypothetical protein